MFPLIFSASTVHHQQRETYPFVHHLPTSLLNRFFSCTLFFSQKRDFAIVFTLIITAVLSFFSSKELAPAKGAFALCSLTTKTFQFFLSGIAAVLLCFHLQYLHQQREPQTCVHHLPAWCSFLLDWFLQKLHFLFFSTCISRRSLSLLFFFYKRSVVCCQQLQQ